MATANIRAVITAEDRASKVVSTFGSNIDKSNSKIVASNQKSTASFNSMLVATAGMGVASKQLLGVIDSSIAAANKYQNALLGLASISKAFGHDVDQATAAAESLAKDGLMTVADSARGLKNLLQSGFSLPEAIKLMERFKDSAAFGKQGALEFGEAIVGATEGIKNGNSILVDNAGVTKNLSRILEEAGFSAQDLMRATTDANVRQALFNGIIKETNANVGDAAKLTETYAGRQAMLTAKTTILKQQIGEALQPALTKLLETITPVVQAFAKFTTDHPQLVAALLIITTAVTGLLAVLGAIGLAVIGLGPIFTAFGGVATAAMGGATAAVGLFSSALTAIPFVAVAAVAVAAGLKMKNAILGAVDAINGAKQSLNDLNLSSDDSVRKMQRAAAEARAAGDTARAAQIAKQINAIAGQRAEGGPVLANNSYLVGEKGPEIFTPNRSGGITPNHQMGGGGTVNITVQAGAFMGSQQDARKYAKMIMDAYKDLMAGSGVMA